MRLPWRGYPREWLVLLLVALAALGPVYADGWPDVSRLALTESIVDRHTVNIDPYHQQTGDESYRHGHFYTDKAPGMSFLALVPFAVFRAAHVVVPPKGANGPWYVPRALWILRILTGGLFFVPPRGFLADPPLSPPHAAAQSLGLAVIAPPAGPGQPASAATSDGSLEIGSLNRSTRP